MIKGARRMGTKTWTVEIPQEFWVSSNSFTPEKLEVTSALLLLGIRDRCRGLVTGQ